jgi:tripartite-type tricarboxylate transporter receptor subunit TctC
MQTKEMKERLATEGAVGQTGTPEQFASFIRTEHQRWGAVVKAAQMKAD